MSHREEMKWQVVEPKQGVFDWTGSAILSYSISFTSTSPPR